MIVQFLAKEAQKEFFKIGRFWGGNYPTGEIAENIECRIEMFDELAEVVLDDRGDLLPEATAQDLNGRWRSWRPLPEVPEYLFAPGFFYHILPNEIFIDIDTDPNDRETLKKVVKELFVILDGLKIPFLAGWTGHRSVHIHIYFALPGKTPVETVLSPEVKEFQQAFFVWLREKLPDDLKKYIDTGVMTASRHVARAFFSLNLKSNTWKVPFEGYDEVKVWKVPKGLYRDILEGLERKRMREELLDALDEDEERALPRPPLFGGKGKYAWIEKVASAGLPDGRKRFIFHVYAPYLVSVKGLGEDEAVEIIMDFVGRCGPGDGKIRESWVRSVVRGLIKRKNGGQPFYPFSLKTFLKRVEESIRSSISSILKS